MPHLLEDDRTLVQRIDDMVDYINCNATYTNNNKEALEIYEGDLLDRVLAVLQSTLSEDYFKRMKSRVIPINFLPRIIDKMAQVYSKAPKRTCEKEQVFIDDYTKWLDLNAEMSLADEYANLFKGYALEPFVDSSGKPAIRSIPFDSFLVMSTDHNDRKNPTTFIKFMGTYLKECEEKDSITFKVTKVFKDVHYFIAYTDDEIVAFDIDGDHLSMVTEDTEGLNPIRRIPFVYGNRSKQRLLPQQDTDIVQMIKMFPVLFSDLGGAVMFQCFTIMYGVNIDTTELKMSPNAFWDLKSNKDNEGKVEVGTIKPEADVDKVLTFISSIFTAWAESKSIRVNSIGKDSAEAFASGVSKAIDEMDTFLVRQKNIPFFRAEEMDLWQLLALMNNFWKDGDEVDQELYPLATVDEKEIVKTFNIDHATPKPIETRDAIVDTQKKEIDNRFTTQKRAISKINPDLSEKEVNALIVEIDKEDEGEEDNSTEDKEDNINENLENDDE